ncbi:hypothetical protein N658DRAFT_561178 [Parathielavia hyrcaniae]|uniref:Uncharacterized protein n=1 Tax=Parathielavia hyrcaniae TaxID=113614 RepID=A0AAN6SZA6_9PEZI|nr:hypothetical protein N658DRAFT_561178 [Parathielavia hyrcaniae]
MELNSGDDLISLKESILSQCSPCTESVPSIANADRYARYNGLTIDSLGFDWRQLVEGDWAIAATLAEFEPGQLLENDQLQECLFRVIIPTAEQWHMPAASLDILQQVCKRCKEGEVADLVSQECLPETIKWKSMRLETPALRSDHGTDCRRLARRVKAFLKEPLPDHRLPLHPVDTEKGEGLGFPDGLAGMGKEKMRALEETLAVTKKTVMYLMQSLKSDLTEHGERDLIESLSTYQGYFVPEDDSCNLPVPSDASSRLSDDIEAAESRIFETELGFWADALQKADSPGRYEDIDVSEMIRAGEFRASRPPSSGMAVPRDLKVDVPLLPCSDGSGDSQAVTQVLAPSDLAEAKELVESSDAPSGSDGPTGQLVSLFQKSATTVMRHAEQEKLQPLDATARISIPVLDFSIPGPEWEQRIWEARAMFRWIQKDTGVDWHGPKWTHNRSAEQRMVWAPLPHMKEKKLVSEQIEVADEDLNFFLMRSRDDGVLSSANYVYKEPGVAVLRLDQDEDDDEEYLSPLACSEQAPPSPSQDSPCRETRTCLDGPIIHPYDPSPALPPDTSNMPAADLNSLLRGRKRLIDEALETRRASRKQDQLTTTSVGFNTTPSFNATDLIDPTLIPSTNVLRGYMSEYTDFAPLIDNFVEMNFPKKPKLTHSSFAPPSTTTTPGPQSNKADEAARLMPPPPKPIPALAPPITPPLVPPRVVVSSTTPTPLTQHLRSLLPTIELIHRNPLDKHCPPGWIPGAARSPKKLDEADLVVSPATGILLTTMIQLRQKPVPGQAAAAASSNVRRIVEKVAVRHERLVVLVSEGNKHSETASPLSQSDARALAGFQGFAAGLRAAAVATAEVRVVYVGGGVETLSRWVAAVVCEYHAREVVAAGVRDMLLPVETSWEVFLRRAGLNVFAAQVVLGTLKVPADRPAVGGGDGEVFGLPLFVMMSKERRVELFQEAFGGRRVLDRVSDALDEPWGEQAVGCGSFDPGSARPGGFPVAP